jgi:hypothetical protein
LDAAEVVATPYQIEDARTNARALAGVLDLDAAEVEAKLTTRDGGGAPQRLQRGRLRRRAGTGT